MTRQTVACLSTLLLLVGCGRANVPLDARESAPILLFNGVGTSPNDVAVLEELLAANDLRYSTADSRELGAMSTARLRQFKLLIVPGGDFEKIGRNLSDGTTAMIRDAVRGGLNYHGICAGAFFAGVSPYNGLNLTGVQYKFYWVSNNGVRKAPTRVTDASARSLDQYWEVGPELSGWGQVVARYPDRTPAVVQGKVGAGWVVLTGVHSEAPESWRKDIPARFMTPVADSNAYAVTLIRAALDGTPLRHFETSL